jgi:apolipoprotein N-acyltransferase
MKVSASSNPKSKIQNLKSWLAAAISGLLLVACFPQIHLPGLVWVACLPLVAALAREKRLKRAFLLGYVCGAFFFAGSCYWFLIVMELYGHLARALAVVVLVLFVIVDSVFFGGFGLAVGWMARRSPAWALAASPFLWVAMELARTYLVTGFPWDLLGYAVQASGVRQIASVTGVYGLSFLAVATSVLMAWVLLGSSRFSNRPSNTDSENREPGTRLMPPLSPESSPSPSRVHFRPTDLRFGRIAYRAFTWNFSVLVLASWVVLLLVAQWRLAPPPPVKGRELALLVQPNVPLDEAAADAWAPWRDPTQLERLVQFSEAAAASIENRKSKIENPIPIANRQSAIDNVLPHPPLLVWAENPAPFFFTRDPIFRNALESMARQTHAYVITNTIIPLDAAGDEITNSAVTLDPEGREVSRYDKIHLVPFGEYVPWWALPGLVHKITSEIGNFVPGTSYTVAPSPGGGFGVFICYEAIIPQLARRLVAAGANVLVNISNDAWYGDSAAAYQHLEMARLRAIENHRYLLRATNNGLTTLIDPYGRVLDELPRYQRLVMPARFDYETRMTFYSAHGDVFAWLCVAIGGVMLMLGRKKRGVRSEELGVRS